MLSVAKKSFASTLSTEFVLIFITGLRALYNLFGDYQWRTQKIFLWGVFILLHMVVICIWCALFVCHHIFDVIFMFPNQRFGDVCWHNKHVLLHALALFFVSLHWIWAISAPIWDFGVKYTQRYDTAVHNCKSMRLRVETSGGSRGGSLGQLPPTETSVAPPWMAPLCYKCAPFWFPWK